MVHNLPRGAHMTPQLGCKYLSIP